MNAARFFWRRLKGNDDLHLKRGGLRGRTYASVSLRGGTWFAILDMHRGPAHFRSVRCESEQEAIRTVELWLEGSNQT